MKNLKRIFSIVISLTMVLSLFGAFSAQAEDTEYTFHTQVGTAFVPETEGVTWQGTDSIDTSVMGRQVISGTDNTTGASVKGIINVGVQKWNSYQNNEGKSIGSGLSYGSAIKDEWRYASASDDAELATYVQDPKNSNDTVVKYTGGAKTLDTTAQKVTAHYNQIAYYLAKQTASGNAYTVEFRFMADSAAITGDVYSIVFRNGSNYDTFNIKRVSSGLTLSLTGSSSAVTYGKNPKVNEWLDIKYMVYKDGDTFKSSISLDNEKILETTTKMVSDSAILPIEYFQIKNSGVYTANPERFAAYLDDIKITDDTTTDFIYYDNFENVYNYDFLQGEGTETINVCEEVKLVDAEGNDSGYSVPIFATASADISTLGTYGSTTAIEGFDEPINISWTVYKEAIAWQENFQGYEESGIGSAPYLEPFAGSSDTTGKTVEFESETSPNKLLKYTTKTKDEFALFTNNEYIDGKVKVSFRFMVPELYNVGNFSIPIMGYNENSNQNIALIELAVRFNSSGKGIVAFKQDAGKSQHYILNQTLEAKKWYKLDFTIDLDSDTFTYALDDVENEGTFEVGYSGLKFSQLRLAQRDSNVENDVTLYLDDLKAHKYLTIKEPVNKTINVYKGDEIAYPETVEVLLTDNKTTDTAPVRWNGSIDTTAPGTKTITGKVTGTSAPITLTAVITPYPYEIVSPVLKNGETEVFGLIDGGNLSAVTVKKISNETIPGKLYAALYDVNGEMLGVNLVSMPTADTWVKDEIKDVAITLSLDVESTVNIDECKLKTFIFSDSLEPYAISNIMTNANSSGTPTVWIAGDSTAARYAESRRPETGWAETFNEDYAALAGITVQNGTINGVGGISGTGALGGQSSKSYVDQGRLEKILENAQAGDYLFIQFGHNDSADEEYRHTDPDTTYKEYITTFVTEARKHGVIPVIFTSIARGRYTGANGAFNGDTHANLDKYANAAKEIAALYHVPMVDLHKKTSDVLRQLNADEAKKYFLCLQACTAESDDGCVNVINGETNHALWCANYPEGTEDRTHLNQYGAQWVAGLAAQGLQEIKLPLANLLKTQ